MEQFMTKNGLKKTPDIGVVLSTQADQAAKDELSYVKWVVEHYLVKSRHIFY